MSAPESASGRGIKLSRSTRDLRTFAAINNQYASELSTGTIDLARQVAAYCLDGLYRLPPERLCQLLFYREVGPRSGAELGGGLQINFSVADELIGVYGIGVQVSAYRLGDGRVGAVEPFSIDQAEEVARGVEGVSVMYGVEGLVVSDSLSYFIGQEEPIIIAARDQIQ